MVVKEMSLSLLLVRVCFFSRERHFSVSNLVFSVSVPTPDCRDVMTSSSDVIEAPPTRESPNPLSSCFCCLATENSTSLLLSASETISVPSEERFSDVSKRERYFGGFSVFCGVENLRGPSEKFEVGFGRSGLVVPVHSRENWYRRVKSWNIAASAVWSRMVRVCVICLCVCVLCVCVLCVCVCVVCVCCE